MAWPAGVGPAPDTVDRLCHVIIDLVGDFAEDAEWELPDRRFVSPGTPPWDQCGQVSVHAETHYGQTGDLNQQTAEQNPTAAGWAMRAVRVDVTIVRCLTAWEEYSRLEMAQVPDVAFDEADAKLTTGDAQVVLSAVIWGTMNDRLPLDRCFTFGGAQTLVDGDQVAQVVSMTFDLPEIAMFFVEHPDA